MTDSKSFYASSLSCILKAMMSFSPGPRSLRVFLSHASDDKPAVRELSVYIRSAGIDIWLDEERLLPGQDWKAEIAIAVRDSDAIIVCISQKATTKEGYVQREIRLALDVADEKPDGTIFLIPVRLDNCSVPERLSRWQWVDLFPSDGTGYVKLVRALIERARSLDSVVLPVLGQESDPHQTPEVKYFYYVSAPKLDILASQLGLAHSGQAVRDVVRDVCKTNATLQSKGLIEELRPDQRVETGQFYISTTTWRHGLFYFKAGASRKHPYVTGVMYALWTTHADSVLLLVGSPDHILGEKIVHEGIFIPGTSGAVDLVFKIAQKLSVDEPALVTRKMTRRWDYDDVPGYDIPADAVGNEGAERDERHESNEIDFRLPLPCSWNNESNALSLAMLCFRHLDRLRSTRIEVLFRLFTKESAEGSNLQDDLDDIRNKWLNYDFIRKEPERMAEERAIWEQIGKKVGQFQLGRYKDIYVGSPVYTAIL